MIPSSPTRRPAHLNGATIILAVVAMVGWGAFIWAMISSHAAEGELSARLSQATTALDESRMAREADQAALAALPAAQQEAATLRQQVDRLTQERDQAAAALAAAQSAASQPPVPEPEQAERTGAMDPRSAAMRAQQVLSERGYGPLVADGIIGAATRRAVESFQRDNGLPVSGTLDRETLNRLAN